ncbi:MAG: alpha/beta fold hydrolase [Chitinispirillaceae bacterium]|jgi:hypothetical protein|nr:alpha/beta fold hydrolase [Chitinispirillaceae bacterium]
MAPDKFSFVEWKNGLKTLRGSVQVTRQKGAPWLICCHGFTGQRMGPSYLFVHLSRALALQGVSSLRFDFGGSGESDGLFSDMTIATMQADLLSAVRMIRRRFAPSRLILFGHSLGGMVAALCVRDAKFDGLVLLAPVGDPAGLIRRRTAVLDAGPNEQGFYENGAHELSSAFLDGLRIADPVRSMISDFRGKLLVIQGDSDASIPVSEAGRYSLAASEAGIENVFHIVKNGDHNFSSVGQRTEILGLITSWTKEFSR